MTAIDRLRRRLRRSPAYTLARGTRLRLRSLSGPRALPDFLVIGAHKAGTTSFYKNLCTHPQVFPAWTKEVHYFDRRPLPPLGWYRAHFPARRQLAAARGITGEASPSYCLFPELPELVRRHMPQCRLIMLLRDPVARAYSAHQYNLRRGMAPVSFEDWIERDFRRIGGRHIGAEEFAALVADPNPAEHAPLGLLRGIYVEQIKFWHAAFPPAQLLVLDSAEYFADPPALLGRVARDYLGLEEHAFAYRKTRSEARAYPRIAPETAERLRGFYRPYNAALEAYLGRSFGW